MGEYGLAKKFQPVHEVPLRYDKKRYCAKRTKAR